ncbi:hypothetical protein ACIP5Y_21350 [Nocardia sp. NPDC088792]|uniref:hypothetical protein n=1 Tax=Nocardia sp. NPDC088792 TaxID=3364332 RepID=UPI0037F822A6
MNHDARLKDLWGHRHRYCHDASLPMGLDEARFVLTAHAGHGHECLQFAAAMARCSEVSA